MKVEREEGRQGESETKEDRIKYGKLLKHTELSERICKKLENSGVSAIVMHWENSHCSMSLRFSLLPV